MKLNGRSFGLSVGAVPAALSSLEVTDKYSAVVLYRTTVDGEKKENVKDEPCNKNIPQR